VLEFDGVRCWTRGNNETTNGKEVWPWRSYIGLCLSSALWWQDSEESA